MTDEQRCVGAKAPRREAAAELSGDEAKAIIWFKHQPLASWGRTAEDVVELGYADAVLDELERQAEGVYS